MILGKTINSGKRVAPSVLALAVLASIAGCATPPPANDKEAMAAYMEANDPLEPMNRSIFEINRGIDQLILRPIAELYRSALPDMVRNSIRSFVNNLETPNILIHDLLQGETERASDSLDRFITNTAAGPLGLRDVAAGDNPVDPDAGVPFHNEDLGQTLAVWGVDPGPYLMLPILGPSNVRDAIGSALNFYINPINYVMPLERRLGFALARKAVRGVDARSRIIESFDEIERGAIDFYATVRSLYRQYRASQIANGRGPANPLPEMSGEFEEDNETERVSSAVKK
ncbi:MAG: putative phospholipid-binding lipoprotein MlaA [Alphaproteobacteria bacterium MarineAlpha1_Bin1]|nr:MAG: putative phospholipid-binding lipoprotein MlaA [Alphaproteobacteria bacterium MarineAlpha1_Bin1]